ncbi:Ribose-5-phosphate isomerase A [Pseudovibrio sp. Ad46]|uniref:ribose-5-phosphate isomerase RpiA n=1 Tax=unclassified Pseudovibrio TaxID=2627060 RepID=UPI0007AEAE6A|nr:MULTISPECIES: ribose-5-phosphate isomerase RpiA [unclassified Pseudovibrio]KZK86565.1 Ribose-5-phosphate isomerase A [Pseudovibrio sp. Ad46]KZK92491.1 Ribose-5-phosphate isomerase A [Pseudovibrio sp. W74]KZL08614.1 Ribose-5-phosphate isomerase A [Pseudovibrio sp. Ad14]
MAMSLKAQAAAAALKEVKPGMKLGIGSGSTVNELIRLLAEMVKDGFEIIGVPASSYSQALCDELGVPLTTLDETPVLDLVIDGADEIDPQLNLIKGGGAALLREKIIAAASGSMLVIADESKIVDTLGKFPLPVEVVPFGLEATRQMMQNSLDAEGLQGEMILRMAGEKPLVTDNGNYILDCHLQAISSPKSLAKRLEVIPGVVEHGLFIDMAVRAYVAGTDEIRVLEP